MTGSSDSVVVGEHEDVRTDGPMVGDERSVLDHWLDLYRDTVLLEIAGLDAGQLAQRPVPPSPMSLLGVVRHLTEVEAYWLGVVLLDEEDVPDYYCTPASPDGDSTTSTLLRRTRTSPPTAPSWPPPARTPQRGPPPTPHGLATRIHRRANGLLTPVPAPAGTVAGSGFAASQRGPREPNVD